MMLGTRTKNTMEDLQTSGSSLERRRRSSDVRSSARSCRSTADRKTRRRGVLEHDRDLLKKRREMAIMDEGRRQLAGRMSRQKNLAAGEVAEHRRCRHVQDVGEQAVARGRAWQQKDERQRYVAEDLDGKRQKRPGRSPRGGWREGRRLCVEERSPATGIDG
jgi:1,4-alpha-glucan branching enzyme